MHGGAVVLAHAHDRETLAALGVLLAAFARRCGTSSPRTQDLDGGRRAFALHDCALDEVARRAARASAYLLQARGMGAVTVGVATTVAAAELALDEALRECEPLVVAGATAPVPEPPTRHAPGTARLLRDLRLRAA